MNSTSDNIRELMSQYIEFDDQEWDYFLSILRFKEVRKGEIVVCEGSLSTNIYFIINGALRTYFTNDSGQERTFHFSLENTFAVDYESFLKGTPSKYSIQALEQTSLALISIDMLRETYKTMRNGERLGRIIAEKYFFLWSGVIQDMYMLTPIERYNNMTRKFPNIINRVPQHYIASYLNITPVHLSRLKREP